ncbi:MAG: hypothetical protein WCH99_11060 [Verrucomicrobiota bacterium]
MSLIEHQFRGNCNHDWPRISWRIGKCGRIDSVAQMVSAKPTMKTAIQKALVLLSAFVLIAQAKAFQNTEVGEFAARDPNPYAFVLNNPVSFIDAIGLRPINVEFDAFIPRRLGAWIKEPFPFSLFPSPWYFRVDERSFGGGSSRLHATASVESLDIGKNAQTRGGYRNGNYPHSFWSDASQRRKLVDGEWFYDTPATATAGGSAYLDEYKCRSELRFVDVHAAYGYHQTISPDIDFSVSFRFEVVGKNKVKVSVFGSHNLFPNYEGLVDSQILYFFDTAGNGPNAFNLNKSTSFGPKSMTIDAETPICCP